MIAALSLTTLFFATIAIGLTLTEHRRSDS